MPAIAEIEAGIFLRATSFYRRDGTDGSNWDNHPQRGDDVLTIAYRGGLMWSPDWYPAGSLETPYRRFAQVRARLGDLRLGEYVNRITHTEIGWRDAAGIIAPPNRSGQICFGPSVNLSPGCYMAIFWIVPNSDSTDRIANGSLGHVDVSAPNQGRVLARQEFERGSQELVLGFTITRAMADWPIEFRVFSHGRIRLCDLVNWPSSV